MGSSPRSDSKWEERSIVPQGSGGFRISPPRAWARDISDEEEGRVADNCEMFRSGEYVILRPTRETRYSEAVLDELLVLPADDLPDDQKLQRLVENQLQSYYIAGIEEIDVQFPDEMSEATKRAYLRAFRQAEQGSLLKWDLDDEKMEIRGAVDFEDFVDRVRRVHHDMVYNATMYAFEDPAAIPKQHEIQMRTNEVDRLWALTTRELGQIFMEMDRQEFARGLCGLYVGKYLEMSVDLAEEYVKVLSALAHTSGPLESLVESALEELTEILSGIEEQRMAFDREIEFVAREAYARDIESHYYPNIYQRYEMRSEALQEVRALADFQVEDLPDDVDPGTALRTGRQLGELIRLLEQLSRVPLRLVQAGIGGQQLEEIHGLSPNEN